MLQSNSIILTKRTVQESKNLATYLDTIWKQFDSIIKIIT